MAVGTASLRSALLAGIIAAHAATTARANDLAPIIGLVDGRVTTCGVRAAFDAPTRLSVELVVTRTGDTTVFVLSADGPAAADAIGLSLATVSQDTNRLLPPAVLATATSPIRARGSIDATVGAFLFRDLLVGGGTVSLMFGDRPTLTLPIVGPALPSVRAAYLQCAGDVFSQTR